MTRKDTLWKLFGDVIYKNLERNLDGTKLCKTCGERFKYNVKSKKETLYCNDCARKINIKNTIKNRKNNKKIINQTV